MSGTRETPERRRSPMLYAALGGLVGIALVIVIGGAILLTRGPGNAPAATLGPTSAAVATLGPSAAPLPSAVGATLEPTLGPTLAPTVAPTPAPTAAPAATSRPTAKPTPRPTATPPLISSFTADPDYVINCQPGTSITLSWTTSIATEVRIAVDPVGGDPLDHIYLQDLPPDGSSDPIFFPCDPPNEDPTGSKYHEYVLIALKGSAITTRSIKVFVNNPPQP